MRRGATRRTVWLVVGLVMLGALVISSIIAPDFVARPDLSARYLGPLDAPPLGTNDMGIPLTEFALQGAKVVAIPSVLSGLVVMVLAILAGLMRCAGFGWVDNALQLFQELVGALPRLVVILVVAVAMPPDYRSLLPIGLTWAVLSAPGAMDEAATTAGRLGGASFVEALRAHGFTAMRIYLYHITWLNLRSVIVRQGAEVIMQVVFLEIALSYLAVSQRRPAFTHPDSVYSWASLLYDGYTWLVASVPMAHAMGLGLVLVALIAFMSQSFRLAARSR
jgi:ABC-type dipeptide/oligopeptide/nickel transport system permease subunit